MSMQKIFLLCLLVYCTNTPFSLACETPLSLSSPDRKLRMLFCLKEGSPFYSLKTQTYDLLFWSKLGFDLENQPPLDRNFRILNLTRRSQDIKWEQPWGEERWIRDHFNQLTIELQEQILPQRKLEIVFRAYNDGIAFRYIFPEQKAFSKFSIKEELTEFQFPSDPHAWWIPAYTPSVYESLYQDSPLSLIPSDVHTPLTVKLPSHHLSLHEAALVNYSSMQLKSVGGNKLVADLAPWSDGVIRLPHIKVRAQTPLKTPWRTIQVARSPGELITSYLILNLNEPNKAGDVSWIKTGKFLGIWWGMHIEKFTWGASPILGATTKNVLHYLDLAHRLKIPALLIEGWNQGWDGDWFQGTDFLFTTPNRSLDFEAILAKSKSLGIDIIGHHETAGAVEYYEKQAEAGFRFYNERNIQQIKTGYVGSKVQNGEYHYGQFMVNHHQWLTELALKHRITLNVHEGVKDTGLRRTYPNLMTREAVRGTEYDAWSNGDGNPPSHTVTLPFTRGLSGPMDFTPGIFDLLISEKAGKDRVLTTLSKQLALFVVLYSPWQMVADLPEKYLDHPAFRFIQDVPTDWETTKVLNGEIGEYITTVRKDRKSEDWYLGSMTNEHSRSFQIPLHFLKPNQKYCAEIYSDHENSHWQNQPLSYEMSTQVVKSTDKLTIQLAPGGGQAIRFHLQASDGC